MKPILLPALCTLLLVITGCSSIRPTRYSIDDVTVVIVDYRYDPSTEREIRHILSRKRVSDWTVRKTDTEATIEARYQELPVGIAAEIDERLVQMPSVIHVEIRKDGVPVRNAN